MTTATRPDFRGSGNDHPTRPGSPLSERLLFRLAIKHYRKGTPRSYERPRSHRTAVAPATKPNSTATAMAPAKWTFIVTIDAQLRCEVPVFDNSWLSGAFGQVPHGCPFLSTFAVTLAGSAVKSQASTNITEPIQSSNSVYLGSRGPRGVLRA